MSLKNRPGVIITATHHDKSLKALTTEENVMWSLTPVPIAQPLANDSFFTDESL